MSKKAIPPEFLCSIPLRKTRAGLQITCAAAVVDSCQNGLSDVWICSSDGYVGQVSVLTFQNEPVIASSVDICKARILCIAAVPGVSSGSLLVRRRSILIPYLPGFKFEKIGKGEKDLGKIKSFPLDSDSDDDYIDATDDFASEDANTLQPTMWLGTEDGCIYIFNCTDMKLQRPKLRIYHSTSIYDILHVNERVFVSLANGEIAIYSRDHNGLWNTNNPYKIQVATNVTPILKMILVDEKLWCSTLNSIAIIDTTSLELEYTFQVVSDLERHITSLRPFSIVYLLFCYYLLHDEIIKQHKLACLRISSVCVEKNLLWIGTSTGVVLNLVVPPAIASLSPSDLISNITGMTHGHFGHVRFITSIHAGGQGNSKDCSPSAQYSALVISGGDGYEDFGNVTNTAGCDDSTNHLLMWRV
ncbi:rho guanine nucleotide exchange factor 17 [Caerostris extrusa]|uniref:Rho guanine nucleotide exchange factor 17 n=1 Tax=Caerostris extrusa TaxID=172846 RepID=A0AAV4S7V8_CAEEX|nr:rho guanine nucleotide exchange factor 17 [Caerostris extrusa]